VPGTAIIPGVVNPVFSPDGQSIAFYTDRTLRRVPVGGGTPFTLATEFPNPLGMCWSESGIYAAQTGVGIVRVPETGGKPQVVATVQAGESAAGPQVLDDGETLIFTIYSGSGSQRYDKGTIVAHSLRTGERKVVHDGGSDGQVLPSGHLVFGVNAVMYVVKLDLKTLTASGPPVPVLQGVRRSGATGAMMFRVASNGTLVYYPGSAAASTTPRSLGVMDRSGKVVALNIPNAAFDTPRFSPDGKRIAVVITTETDSDIWIQDYPVQTALRRLTFGGRNRLPVWSPDSAQIAFQSNREGDDAVYVQSADVSGATAERVAKADGWTLIPTSWSPDGWLAITKQRVDEAALQVLSLKDRKLVPFSSEGPGVRRFGAVFHPGGHWMVYQEIGRSGPPKVYVEPFPATTAKYQIESGFHAVWTRDGKQLLLNVQGPSFVLYNVTMTPRVLFAEAGHIDRGQSIAPPVGPRQFDISHDGQLLVVLPTTEAIVPDRELRVVLNWFEELKK
jgi:hypothetical protein